MRSRLAVMPATETFTIRVPPEMAQQIRERVAAGEAASVNAWAIDAFIDKLAKGKECTG